MPIVCRLHICLLLSSFASWLRWQNAVLICYSSGKAQARKSMCMRDAYLSLQRCIGQHASSAVSIA